MSGPTYETRKSQREKLQMLTYDIYLLLDGTGGETLLV